MNYRFSPFSTLIFLSNVLSNVLLMKLLCLQSDREPVMKFFKSSYDGFHCKMVCTVSMSEPQTKSPDKAAEELTDFRHYTNV